MASSVLWCMNSKVCDAFAARSFSCEKEAHRLKKDKRMQVLCCGNSEHHHQNQRLLSLFKFAAFLSWFFLIWAIFSSEHCFAFGSSINYSLAIQYLSGTQRRQVLFQTVFAAVSFPPIVSIALANNDVLVDFRLYSDEANKFKIMIPQDWQVGAGENNGIKSVTGFFPAEPSNSNVTVVITGLGPDFTRLESFGKVDAFAETLVSGLDRSWQRPPGVAAKLIDSKAANGLYYIEYTLQNPGETRRHLFSVLGMANNGWYNRLYTVTGQFVDEDSEKYGSLIEKAVSSFRLV